MVCSFPKPIFPSPYWIGIQNTNPEKDGYSIYCSWSYALSSNTNNTIGYNVYFSTIKEDVFTEGPKYFTQEENLTISRFNPGTNIYFAERATEYDPDIMLYTAMDPSAQAPNAYIYPETALDENIDAYQTYIPLVDCSGFPVSGIIKVGSELISYYTIDYGSNIVYAYVDGRGTYDTNVRPHTTDGYDGYKYQDPIVRYFSGFEDGNTIISIVEPRIEYPEFPYVESDGYKQTAIDLLTTSLSASDQTNEDFPSYDYSSYHQTHIIDYFSGSCIGSYSGGEFGCADGYKMRGLNLQDQSSQRLEMMLDVTGEPVVLLRRLWAGIRCKCFRMNQEAPEGRCEKCFGVGFVGGYDQFYNPRRSDGRIIMRFDPTVDDLSVKPHGLQQNFVPNCWTLVYPAIKDRDILIRFNEDGTEEFRYEVVNVTRNKLLFSLSGAQKMQVYRLDKTDIIYQWRAIRDTSFFPEKVNTSISTLRGYGPHLHEVTINEDITSLSQINSTTSVVAGHNHPIINGILQEVLGHSHTITI